MRVRESHHPFEFGGDNPNECQNEVLLELREKVSQIELNKNQVYFREIKMIGENKMKKIRENQNNIYRREHHIKSNQIKFIESMIL